MYFIKWKICNTRKKKQKGNTNQSKENRKRVKKCSDSPKLKISIVLNAIEPGEIRKEQGDHSSLGEFFPLAPLPLCLIGNYGGKMKRRIFLMEE